MAFERFNKRWGRKCAPTLTLMSNGQISINTSVQQEYDLQKYTHYNLFYDKENKRIGIKFSETGDYKIVHVKKGPMILTIAAFLRFYSLTHLKRRHLNVECMEGAFMVLSFGQSLLKRKVSKKSG